MNKLLMILLSISSILMGYDGMLDSTFSEDGIVLTAIGININKYFDVISLYGIIIVNKGIISLITL